MTKTVWLRWIAVTALVMAGCGGHLRAQTSQKAETEFVRRARTLHIPLTAIARQTAMPVADLKESDFTLDIDGKPVLFQLARPWSGDTEAKTDQAQDRTNLLIILPFASSLDRRQALEEAIADLSKLPELDWNISILDDVGNQTPYTRSLKTAIAELRMVESESPDDVDLEQWRTTAALAIAGMRDLPGRRAVMTLGDIFHEMVVEDGELEYAAFQIDDLAGAARNAGAVIYAAESANEIDDLRKIAPYVTVVGANPGPWLLLGRHGHVAGWISGSVADTLAAIRRDAIGSYRIDLHLGTKQMNGQLHSISVRPRRTGILLDAPRYFVAPDLTRLRQLAAVSPALRKALRTPPPAGSSPLEMETQLAYFPHRDGKTGTQIATTGFFWNASTPPPASLDVALKLEETMVGYVLNTTVATLDWSSAEPVWNASADVGPGAYLLRVAATDASGKIAAAADTQFTVEPTAGDKVLISSVVLGKSCLFAPPPSGPDAVDYLRAGNCDLDPDPTHRFSPQDVVWTLARITPLGELAGRPSKDWKASFELIDANGSRRTEQRVHWFPAPDGSFVATAAIPLDNPKLKLKDGEYAIVFHLEGPGIARGYGEDAEFKVFGVPDDSQKKR